MKSNKPLFSIILPVFNREHYLESCLKSVFSQSIQDFEILAIDDGSKDASLSVLQKYANQKLRIFSQKNLGVSQARNLGIQHSQGTYICFMDSDDILHKDYLLSFYNTLLSTQAEIVKNTHIVKFQHEQDLRDLNTDYTKTKHHFFIPSKQTIKIGCTIWSYCIKRSLIVSNHLFFLPQRIMEDEAFVFMMLPFANKVSLCYGAPYYYRQHPQSIVAKSPVAFDRIQNFKDIIAWYQNKNIIDRFPIPFYMLYDISINNNQYFQYLQQAQTMLKSLKLEQYLSQDKLAEHLYNMKPEDFMQEHQKSRGKIKYYLKRLFKVI